MQALQGAAPTAKAIQKVGWASTFHKVLISICDFVSVFSFSDFKAKAFSFCLFFYSRVIGSKQHVTPDLIGGLAEKSQILAFARMTRGLEF